ncbi:hypothetical protein SJPD1_2186 [Sulfurospirillum diekertiae]|uniref:Uncharacterized protein n=1 Tax=Sulfurospirillum diekertiae TaxID=1854492 RepID=A0A290HUH0_9BACT|nr:hypothetical protein [Sulfurospirillum diekertiae]ATB70284.1 hypothetical protein SJPD1_2186 [Sulfurospirillum diekertiae]
MGISISSSTAQAGTYITPRIKPTAKELAELKKEPTKVTTEGNIYTSTAIHFKELSLEELKYEKISVDKSKFTYVSYSDGTKNEPNRLVVMHDPENNNKFVTIQLSKKSIDQLKQKFDGTNNFFERSDGTLRLNGDAEAFVAGWMQNIRVDRNYTKSDADGNGLIEGDEAKNLTVGMEGYTNYDYIGKKVVKINMGVVAKYKILGDSAPSASKNNDEKEELQSQHSSKPSPKPSFENSVEKELQHTLQMDTNLDGTVTLEESLKDQAEGTDYRQKIITSIEKFHTDFLDIHTNLNDDSKLQNYDFGFAAAKKEQEATLQQKLQDALKISTFELLNFTNQKEKNISDTLKQLQIQTTKSPYFDKQDIEKISG